MEDEIEIYEDPYDDDNDFNDDSCCHEKEMKLMPCSIKQGMKYGL